MALTDPLSWCATQSNSPMSRGATARRRKRACLGGEGYPGQVTSYCTQDEEGVLCVLVFAKLASDVFRQSIRRVRARLRSMTTNPLPRWECSKEPPAGNIQHRRISTDVTPQ